MADLKWLGRRNAAHQAFGVAWTSSAIRSSEVGREREGVAQHGLVASITSVSAAPANRPAR